MKDLTLILSLYCIPKDKISKYFVKNSILFYRNFNMGEHITTETFPSPHIFWLLEWNVVEIYTMFLQQPLFVPCRIDTQSITIELTPKPLVIPYNQIVQCEKYVFSQGGGAVATVNIKIILAPSAKITKGRLTRNEIYLVPANPLHGSSMAECDDMIEVINSYRQNLVSSIDKNPYYRELLRRNRIQEFSEETWRSEVSPLIYTPLPGSLKTLLKTLLIALIITLIGLIIIGIIYNLLY